jgi:hypothetical protein
MSTTKHASDLEDRYPPGHETRQAVARYLAGLRVEKPYKSTVRVLEIVDDLAASNQRLGQALAAMAREPADVEPVTVSERDRNEKRVRYTWEVDGDTEN